MFSEYHFVKLFHYAGAEKLKKVETPSMMQSRVKNEPL
ncbi:hypothetical protein RV02_GL003452 [Enterococcus gilvus]|nr:hypothetical protein RV02_GL003452 [Enterococcus gilvus]